MTAGLAMVIVASSAAMGCTTNFSDLLARREFHRFPAPVPTARRWRPPDTRSGEAHLFRTTLHRFVTGPPDFAGRYTVLNIGCGAGASCPAFVDRITGHVRFEPALRVIADTSVGGFRAARLTYYRDSRLLIAWGARNEEDRFAGASLFDMRGGRLHLIRFVPESAVCRREEP